MAENTLKNTDVGAENCNSNIHMDACDGDDIFVWQDYLDVTHTTEVPQVLFSHVEDSLLNGLQEGMILEVPLKEPTQYWVASIVMACGPLLRLRYVGQPENPKQEFWCDLSKVHPIGWCKDNNLLLTVPDELQDKPPDPDSFVQQVIRTSMHAPSDLLTGEGLTPIDRIVPGMKLEVQDEMNPHQLWVVTIVENVGGRLLLRYDTPDSSTADFWLFYNSPRLFPNGWAAEKGTPWELKRPSSIVSSHGEEEWAAVLELGKEGARGVPLPPDMFQHDVKDEPHEFEVGMKLEAIHPQTMIQVCPATVTQVFDEFHFLVQIDSLDNNVVQGPGWLCTACHPYILPIGWAHEHDLQVVHPPGWTAEFTWTKYLSSTLSQAAPKQQFFKHNTARKAGFKQGMKLEVVNPENKNQICAATIVRTMEHLMLISIESNDSSHLGHILSIESLDIFPVGWCESNLYPLQPPRFYQIPAKPVKAVEVESFPNRRSSWCPKIYFNHRCFTGPFLSKGKLAKLPKSVGPGPVTLVLREVLGMLISIAYKSSRVLKELQETGNPERGLHSEAFKAKYKTNTYKSNIAIVTSADKVPDFCKDICTRLQVCPNLFGLTLLEICPDRCNNLSKTRFTQYWVNVKRGRPKGEASNIVTQRKRKRGRSRSLLAIKASKSAAPESVPVISQEDFTSLLALAGITKDYQHPAKDEPEKTHLPSSSNACITSATKIKRRYKKKVHPRTQIKTRGAELPKYSKHWSRKGGWKRHDLSKRGTRYFASSEHQQASVMSHKTQTAKLKVPLCNYTPPNVIKLESDPRTWSCVDVFKFLKTTDDCNHVAQLCRDQMIDGHSFLLLNLPTMREQLYLKMDEALKLCYHVAEVKLALYQQYNCDV